MRKGQLTLFIILGIILVIIVGVGIYLFKDFSTQDGLTVTTETQPVNAFIARCMEETTREALIEIGETGGYLYEIAEGFDAYSVIPTEGRALEAFSGRPPLPYWHYLASRNSCSSCLKGSEQPPLTGPSPSIQWQLQNNLPQRFNSCVNDFNAFEGQYDIIVEREPIFDISFSERDVNIIMSYPITISTESATRTEERFSAKVDVPIKRLYTVATDIRMELEDTGFLEGMTMEAITVESYNDRIPPPYGGIEMGYDPGPIWSLAQVRGTVAEIIEENINIVQLFASRNMNFVNTGNSTTDRMYSNYYLAIGDTPSDVDAMFIYLSEWEPYLRITPGGQIIKPDRMTTPIPLLPQFKRKDFQYDLSYPVLIHLSADTSSEPYIFQYPVEVNVRLNKPMEFSYVEVDEFTEPGLCEPENAYGSTMKVNLIESTSGAPMDAYVRYECANDACHYGESSGGELTARLPPCFNGLVVAEREGFRTASITLDSAEDETRIVNLQLVRLMEVDAQIIPYEIKRDFRNPTPSGEFDLGPWSRTTSALSLDAPYQTIITLTPLDNPDYAQVVVYPLEEPRKIELYPGEWEVNAVVIQTLPAGETLTLKGKEVCGGVFPFRTCETIPDVVLGEGGAVVLDDGTIANAPAGVMYVGGLQLDSETTNAVITREMLESGSIRIPVIVIPLSELATIDDLEALELFAEFSRDLYIY